MSRTFFIIINKAPLLTDHQLERMASICDSIAQVALATVVIPYLIDIFELLMVVLGLLVAILFWALSLMI